MSKVLLIFVLFSFAQDAYSQQYQPSTRNRLANLKDELVSTPVGTSFISNLHYVDNNHYLTLSNNIIQLTNKNTKKVCKIFSNENQTGIVNEFSLSNRSILSSFQESVDGWITYASCSLRNGNDGPTFFSTNWIVPSYPKKSSKQLLYLFNGLEGYISGNTYILQPVLQWGVSPAGGGPYWAICNWLVTSNNQFFYDSLIKVNPGDKLIGVIKMTSTDGTLFNYNSYFEGYTSGLIVENLPQLITPYFTLEGFNIQDCDEYPADEKIRMYNIQIKKDSFYPEVIFYTYGLISNCGQFTNIIKANPNNGEVDIHFHKPFTIDDFDKFYLYPNPVKDQLHISITDPIYHCKIEIYDNLGRIVDSRSYNNLEYELNIDFHNHLPGLYILKIFYRIKFYSEEEIQTYKFIKLK